ncbi:hypothetical protein HanIR_Chr01g0017251 [Helianthus annuus]|nr:hypothetical protein HanIR_Chr01g0017251 [Helianthus annuus]
MNPDPFACKPQLGFLSHLSNSPDHSRFILKLNHNPSNITFHHLTNNFIRIQIPEIHNLSTRIPFIMIPFLNPIPNILQHSSTHIPLPQYLQNLTVNRSRQHTRSRAIHPSPIIPLLTPHIIHLFLLSHIIIHINGFRLLHQSHINTPKMISLFPRTLVKRHRQTYRSICVSFRF